MSIGKFILAGIGWACGGPIGGILGWMIGGIFEGATKAEAPHRVNGRYTNTGTQADINAALLVLIAAVMKADGNVSRAELDYVKKFLLHNYGETRAKQLLLSLREIVKQDIPIVDVCLQIKVNTDYTTRYHMMEFLFGIASADNVFSKQEELMIRTISNHLGINANDFASMYARYAGRSYGGSYQSSGRQSRSTYHADPYKILGIAPTATDEEVKKAYRRLAMKYHPDKVAQTGEDIKANAEAQFRQINEAYEQIKSARGIK